MPLDQSFVGRTYPPDSVYEVSREKIREFADAIGDQSALYRDREAARAAGYPDVIAPPTFLTVINLAAINKIITDPELGLDYGRMVHGDQSFNHVRPVRAGDRLELTTHIEDIKDRAGSDFLTVRAEITAVTEQGSEPVCETSAQLVVRRAQETA